MAMLHDLLRERPLILASASPQRQRLLHLLQLDFKIDPADIEEHMPDGGKPAAIAMDLAAEKAAVTGRRHDHGLIVGADTIVVIDDDMLGKPEDAADAARMLQRLSGRTHEVFTGFALLAQPENKVITAFERTEVTFKALDEEEIATYIATKSPLNKAGAYGIQDTSAYFVTRITGCFYNVVGFPLSRFYQTCRTFLAEMDQYR